jgi:hypothetical protein
MNRGRVGEERGSKEMDRCPLTDVVKGELDIAEAAMCSEMVEFAASIFSACSICKLLPSFSQIELFITTI